MGNEALHLKEGDEIEISVEVAREYEIARDNSRDSPMEVIQRLARPLPQGFKFDREEANER